MTALDGTVDTQSYYALGLADERTGDFVAAALWNAGYGHEATQTFYPLCGIQSGRGAIPTSHGGETSR